MSLKKYVFDKKPSNPITGNRGRKPMTVKEKKVINEKLPDPEGVLRGKPTPYN